MDIDDRKLVAWINPVDGSTPIISVDSATNNTTIDSYGSGIVFNKPLTIASLTVSTSLTLTGSIVGTNSGYVSTQAADLANIPAWAVGAGSVGDARPNMIATTLTPSVTTTNIWENDNSFVILNGPGTATGEINVKHAYFQVNAGATAHQVENVEASMLNNGSIDVFQNFLGIMTNGAAGTATSLGGVKFQLTNSNTTAGSVAQYVAIDNEAMAGAGSQPTANFFIRNADPSGAINSLGALTLGNLSPASSSSVMLNIVGPDTSSSTNVIQVRNSAGLIMTLTDAAGLTIGGAGNAAGNLVWAGATSGSMQMRPSSATPSGTWFLANNGGTDTVAGIATSQTLTNKTLTDFVNTQVKRVSAQTDVSNSTALANVTGLAVALTAAGTYAFRAYVPMTVNATPGAKIAVGTSDTLTATSINYMAQLWNGATISGAGTSTALGTAAVAATAAGTYATIDGVIVVNAAGTLTVQIAQNVSNATATSALVNGYIHVDRIA